MAINVFSVVLDHLCAPLEFAVTVQQDKPILVVITTVTIVQLVKRHTLVAIVIIVPPANTAVRLDPVVVIHVPPVNIARLVRWHVLLALLELIALITP